MDKYLTLKKKPIWAVLLNAIVNIEETGQLALEREDLLSFSESYQCDLSPLIEQWCQRESDFQFLESSLTPSDIEQSISLLKLLRAINEQSQEIKELNMTRQAEGRPPLPVSLSCYTSTIEELTFIEELYDEEVITLVSKTLSTADSTVVKQLISKINHHLTNFCIAYEGVALNPIDDLDESIYWLAYPCKSCKIDSWSNHLDRDEYSFEGVGQRELDEYLNEVHQEWHKIWRVSEWGSEVEWQGETGSNASVSIWSEILEPYLREIVSEAIVKRRNADMISDLNQCFIELIDAKRPKDQRIGSFWINQEQPSEITVIFLTRDGKLLAQRDVTWTPSDPKSVTEAFKIINIRLLTYPKELEEIYPEMLEQLSSLYELRAVSSIVLDPVPHPQSLSANAQKALRIGQRFVAPLRFWARTDLLELMRCFSTPIVFECLERSHSLSLLLNVLKDSCAERWLKLRRKRKRITLNRQKRSHESSPAHTSEDYKDPVTYSSKKKKSSPQYARGDEVRVRVIKRSGFTLHVQTLDELRRGNIRLSTRYKDEVAIDEIIHAYVLGVNPKNTILTLSLRPSVQNSSSTIPRSPIAKSSSKHQRINEQKVDSKDSKTQTIDRLNTLFSEEKPKLGLNRSKVKYPS